MSGFPVLLAALGAVVLLFGLLNLLLALFGATSLQVDRFWILGQLAIGVVMLAVSGFMGVDALRDRMRTGEARRASRFGSSAILQTLLLVLILGVLAFLSTRYHHRFDWTEAGVHSLSDQSLKVLGGLDQDVSVVALFTQVDQEALRPLLDRYAYASDRFVVDFVDPNATPGALGRYGIDREQLGTGVLRVSLGDESTLVDEVTEENVTNAMVKLTRTGEKRVYFVEGHNERAVEDEAGEQPRAYGRAADALVNEGYVVETLLLAAEGDVPEDADVVVISGPTRPLLPQEREALARYLERGGALMALVDPRARTDLVEDLASWGAEVGDDIVIDRLRALFGQPTAPLAAQYASHEITREMREPVLFPDVRSVRSAEGTDLTEIVFTAPTSWAERDLEQLYAGAPADLGPGDLRGPVSIAVAGTPTLARNGSALEGDDSEGEAPEPRIVVFGDADFASNEFIDALRNRDLFLNSVNWLLGDIEAISIRPRVARASSLRLSNEEFLRLRSLSLFVLPEAVAIVGVFVWWSRRWAPER